MDWFLDVIKNKYATFDGRARRKEYWMFNLFSGLISLAISALLIALLIAFSARSDISDSEGIGIIGLIIAVFYMIFILALAIPMWAVTVRRLHDIGKSGWWVWISFVPYIGPIVLLVFCCLDSESGTNKYGPNPKGVGA